MMSLTQASWHRLLKARYSMLKLRLSYNAGTTSYLKGDIFLPVWGPQVRHGGAASCVGQVYCDVFLMSVLELPCLDLAVYWHFLGNPVLICVVRAQSTTETRLVAARDCPDVEYILASSLLFDGVL